MQFSIGAAPIYIPTNSLQGLPFLHILANICKLWSFLKKIYIYIYIYFKYLFIYLFILVVPGLSCGTRDLRCSMWTLSCGMRAGSSSPTRDGTWAHCTGSAESYPQDHHGSPIICGLFDDSHSDRGEMMSHHGFDLHISDD